MLIREMKKEDVREVAQIEKSCFSQAWSEQAFFEELSNPYGKTLVAIVNDTVAGFINMRMIAGEIYINNIAVKEDMIRRGIGDRLLSETECLPEYTEFITLEVRKSNIAAISLYERRGFVKVGERKNFYERPQEDAVLMTKTKETPERNDDK